MVNPDPAAALPFGPSLAPAFWQQHVEQAVNANETALKNTWRLIRGDASRAEGERRLAEIVTDVTMQALDALYPDTAVDLGPAVFHPHPPPLPAPSARAA